MFPTNVLENHIIRWASFSSRPLVLMEKCQGRTCPVKSGYVGPPILFVEMHIFHPGRVRFSFGGVIPCNFCHDLRYLRLHFCLGCLLPILPGFGVLQHILWMVGHARVPFSVLGQLPSRLLHLEPADSFSKFFLSTAFFFSPSVLSAYPSDSRSVLKRLF